MHIGDDPRVFEVDKSVVNKKAASGRGVEYIKVSILDPDVIKVGRRESSSMKGG